MKRLVYLLLFFILLNTSCHLFHDEPVDYSGSGSSVPSEYPEISIHKMLLDEYADYEFTYIENPTYVPLSRTRSPGDYTLNKEVYGFYSYWLGDDYTFQRFDLFSTVAYFALQLDENGNISSWAGWPSSSVAVNVVNLAHSAGCEVQVAVMAFYSSQHQGILLNPVNYHRCITNLVNLIGPADGINLDFEGLSSSLRSQFVNFVRDLKIAMTNADPNYKLSIDTYAVDWSYAIDVTSMSPWIDQFFIMGYDYHWSSGPIGPCSPLTGESYNLRTTTQNYLTKCQSPSKVVVGVPYYGYNWPATGPEVGASKTANATAVLYKYTLHHDYDWYSSKLNPWYAYQNTDGWHQVWFDNSRSIELKMRMLNEEGADGYGMWAMAYDGTESDMWDLIEQYFTVEGQSADEGEHLNPYVVDSYPYHVDSTTIGGEDLYHKYNLEPLTDMSGPEEWYRLYIEGPCTLSAYVTPASGDADLLLLDSRNSNACVVRGDSEIVYDVYAGMWYLVVDTPDGDGNAGEYELSIDTAGAFGTHDNPYLIGSFLYIKSSTTLGKQQIFHEYSPAGSGIDESGPEEVFLLEITEPGYLSLSLTNEAGKDIDVHLLGSLDPNDCLTRAHLAITNQPVGVGTYYIVMDTYYDDTKAGAYTLFADFTPGEVGSHFNPIWITGFPFTTNSTTVGKDSIFDAYSPAGSGINESGPEEVYEIEIEYPCDLTVTVSDGVGVDVDIHLLSSLSESACLIRNDTTFTYAVTSGTYYLVCDTYNGSGNAGAYTLDIDISAIKGSHLNPYVVDSFPFSTNSTTLGKTELFDYYSVAPSTDETGPEEVYEITLASSAQLLITLSDGVGVDVDLHLLSELDETACLVRHNNAITYNLSAGTYYLVCDTYAGSANAGDYTLNISAQSVLPGSHAEPYLISNWTYTNNSTTVGKEQLFTSYSPAGAGISEAGPEEIYRFTVPFAGDLTVNVADAVGLDMDIHLLTNLVQNCCVIRHDSAFNYGVEPGVYYIVVDTYQSADKAGAYTLTVNYAPDMGTPGNPYLIDAFPSGNVTTLSGKESGITNYGVAGVPDAPGPEDVYRIEITERSTLIVTLLPDTNLLMGIYLVNGTNGGDLIDYDAGLMAYTLEPGWYTVICDGQSGDYDADYSVAFAIEKGLYADPFNMDSLTDGWTLSAPDEVTFADNLLGSANSGMKLKGQGSAEMELSTIGFEDITLSCRMAAVSLEGSDRFVVEYDAGSGWTTAMALYNGDDNGYYRSYEIDLPATADNNIGLKIRFRIVGDSADDYGYVDQFEIRGESG